LSHIRRAISDRFTPGDGVQAVRLNRAVVAALAALSLACAAHAQDAGEASVAPAPAAGYVWAPLKIGAGGFITGIDVNKGGRVIYAGQSGEFGRDKRLKC
jgi:hypothetical protein